MASVATSSVTSPNLGSSSTMSQTKDFDVVAAYHRALTDEKYPHPVAAILALVELMEASTSTTLSGLAIELYHGRQTLIATQCNLGVRAGCQLWERFLAASMDSGGEFTAYKRQLIQQGRSFCSVTAPQARDKISQQAVDFLRDDCVILTHSYSRTVIQTIVKAHNQHKRVSVYVTEARPACLGQRTQQILTSAGIPCEVVLDSAVGYVMERVDMVLLGFGTYQVALVAKAMQKPVYALAESYKFLRHYPLSQTDLPMPQDENKMPLTLSTDIPNTHADLDRRPSASQLPSGSVTPAGTVVHPATSVLSKACMDNQPKFDVTFPQLVDFIITDLGTPLSPTSVSQYLVAQFSS